MSELPNRDPQDRWRVELEDAPPHKRGVPLWFWGCGGGCLLMLALFIGGTAWTFSSVYKSIGPEAAWPELAKVLPYGDERPEGYEPTIFDQDRLSKNRLTRYLIEKGGPEMAGTLGQAGHVVFVITEEFEESRGAGSGSRLSLWQLAPGERPEDHQEPVVFNEVHGQARSDEETVEITLQGRKLEGRRYTVEGESLPMLGVQKMQILELDITGERDRALLLKLISTGEVAADEAELNRFLEPFQVWPADSAPK